MAETDTTLDTGTPVTDVQTELEKRAQQRQKQKLG